MFILASAGIVVALIHPPLITLWFLAGTIRLATFAPTIGSIILPKLASGIGTVAILGGLIIGGSVFGIGILTGDSTVRTIGMLLSVGVSALVVLGGWASHYSKARTNLVARAI